jgi:diacylglycerol O-acyltransferase
MSPNEPLSPLMTDRAYDMVLSGMSFPFSAAKAAADRASVKLNDFFVTAVCMGMAEYHQRHGLEVERLRMGMPLNVRSGDGDAAGNQIAAVRLEVPIGCGTAPEQMQVFRALMTTARNEESIDAMGSLYGVVSRLPRHVIASTFASVVEGTDFLASNVPGVPVPVYLTGSRLLEQLPFGPLSTAATNVTLMSYAEQLHIGIAIDSAAIPDREVFIDSMRAGFQATAEYV